MKKIGFISLNDHTPWGGSEVFWSQLAAHFLSSGRYEVAISPKYWNETPEKIEELISNGAADYRRKFNSPSPSRLKKLKDILLPSRVKKSDHHSILHDFKPDLMFISLGNHNAGADWLYKCHKAGIPYVLIVQLVRDANCPDENTRFYKTLREGYLNAFKIFCPSLDNRHLLEKQFGTRLDNVEIINNPVDLERDFPPFPDNEIAQVALVASLNYNHKGQDILLETIRQVKWKNRNIHFNLYGSGPHRKVLERLKDMWEIRNVTFHGHTPLEEIWKVNQALLMPSRMEGLSLAFLEALSMGRMAIVTNLGDTSRFIRDNENGFIIKAPQADFLDEALERAWQHRDKWKDMGRAARKSLLEQIEEDPVRKVVQKIEEYIK